MRAFILVACLAVAAVARPDGGGYNYNGLQQQNQLSLPQSAHSVQPHIHQHLPAEHSFANFGVPQVDFSAPAALGNTVEQLAGPVAHEDTSQQLQQDSYNTAYQQSSIPHEAGYDYAPTQTKVHKHIYVHVPPKDFEDDDVVQTRVHHQAGPKQKHYKIVFIKAPSAPAIRAPIVAPAPQNEEKTLIYVLHKKPELSQDIVIPTPAPTKPSKPEVYFIKYKTKKEQAPVYGPPPALDLDARNLEQAEQYAAPVADDFASMSPADLPALAPITTTQPVLEEHTPQHGSELPAEVYGAPTMGAIHVAEPEPTIAAPTANAQYLAPEATPAVQVAEQPQHLPAASYGPPGRFFNKKK